MSSENKTENPTERRLTKARDEGMIARSPDLGVVATMVAFMSVSGILVRSYLPQLVYQLSGFWRHLHEVELTDQLAAEGLQKLGHLCLMYLWPLLLVCLMAALAVGGLQTGFRLSPKALTPKWDRLDFAAGFKRLFSMEQLLQTALDAVKILIVSALLYAFGHRLIMDPLFQSPLSLDHLGPFLFKNTQQLWGQMAIALGIIAAIHYTYQRVKNWKNLMMSREEVKDELREQEVDPHLKSTRKGLAFKLLQRRMLRAVPTADVVVTNPTHYAAVLKYEKGRDQAPVLVAKGQNLFARRIRTLAQSYGVPIVENPPVARMLYRTTRVGRPIPVELYEVVADILTYVYRHHRYYFHRLKARRLQDPKDWLTPFPSP